jgi:hypothetical protein
MSGATDSNPRKAFNTGSTSVALNTDVNTALKHGIVSEKIFNVTLTNNRFSEHYVRFQANKAKFNRQKSIYVKNVKMSATL